MKLVIAATGASGTIYLQRLIAQIDCAAHEVHLVMSAYARAVAKQEVDDFKIPAEISRHSENDMNVPFVSGSSRFDAMVIVPCSMATLGRIASGCSDSVLLRAADVFLKERRKLILVPRETPWNLIHARNIVTLLEAGAIVLPAIPSFYSRPNSVTAIADTVVWRILDQIGLPSSRAYHWGEESVVAKTSRKKNKRKSKSKRTSRLGFRFQAAGTGGEPRKRGTPSKS
ncbi:MAG TPA: UbiX family flavin prenyltransferase [Candidatus Udaeobacter sp.]|jgi:4-hydroxy-3-polyprenylbenzoate decarboxylase